MSACRHCHGDSLLAAPADRGRAHNRSRRDNAGGHHGADPGPCALAQSRHRSDYPRSGPGGTVLRSGGGDACRSRGRAAAVSELFTFARHPYTAKLLRSVPSMVDRLDQLQAIEGSLPDLRRGDLPHCRFAERCERRLPVCDSEALSLEAVGPHHRVACRNPL